MRHQELDADPRSERQALGPAQAEGLRVANPRGFWIAKGMDDNSLIIKTSLSFAQGAVERRIRFADLNSPPEDRRADWE